MTVQTLKLGRERFVLLREKDYRQLKAKAQPRPVRKGRRAQDKPLPRLSTQDRGDIAQAKRRENEPARPYSELRKELGWAHGEIGGRSSLVPSPCIHNIFHL